MMTEKATLSAPPQSQDSVCRLYTHLAWKCKGYVAMMGGYLHPSSEDEYRQLLIFQPHFYECLECIYSVLFSVCLPSWPWSGLCLQLAAHRFRSFRGWYFNLTLTWVLFSFNNKYISSFFDYANHTKLQKCGTGTTSISSFIHAVLTWLTHSVFDSGVWILPCLYIDSTYD